MKVGDLVRHRDAPRAPDRGPGIVISFSMSRHGGAISLVDVHWTGAQRPPVVIYGYMPSELRPLDESR